MTEATQRYATLANKAKGRRSIRAVAQDAGLAVSTVHGILRGMHTPQTDTHEALMRALGQTCTDEDLAELDKAWQTAMARSAGETPAGRVLLMTLGEVPLSLLPNLVRAIHESCTAAGWSDVTLDPGSRVTAVPPKTTVTA